MGADSDTIRKIRSLLKPSRIYLALSIIVLLVLWYFSAHRINNELILPPLEKTVKAFHDTLLDPFILTNLGITLRRVLIGSCYAVLLGVPLGLLMGSSQVVQSVLSPFVNSIRQIPIMAWVPLSIVWFGLGDGPTLFLITIVGLFPVVLNTIDGVHNIDKDFYNAARSMGANKMQLAKDVIFPGAMPGIFSGVRVAMGLGWMSVI